MSNLDCGTNLTLHPNARVSELSFQERIRHEVARSANVLSSANDGGGAQSLPDFMEFNSVGVVGLCCAVTNLWMAIIIAKRVMPGEREKDWDYR